MEYRCIERSGLALFDPRVQCRGCPRPHFRRQGRVVPGTREIGEIADRVGGGLGITGTLGVLVFSVVEAPVEIGWLRPVMLAPAASLGGLAPSQIEGLLAHELAHVLRHDYLV